MLVFYNGKELWEIVNGRGPGAVRGKSRISLQGSSPVNVSVDDGAVGQTDLMGLAVGVEVGEPVQTLVVLRETAEAQEEGADAHVHQRPPLLAAVRGQRLGHLDHLGRGLRLPLALRGLRGGLLGGGQLWRDGLDGQGVCGDFGGRELGKGHHHRFDHFLDDPFINQDDGMFSVRC